MKKLVIAMFCLAFVVALVMGAVAPKTGAGDATAQANGTQKDGLTLKELLEQNYSREELETGVYVGAEYCIACHGRSGWRSTAHSSFLRRAMTMYSLVPGKGVVADYDGNLVDDFIQGLDFNTISSVFDAYKPNAPILGVTGGQYTIKIGDVTYPVVFTLGGGPNGQGQRYLVRIPVTDTPNKWSAAPYFSPVNYAPGSGYSANSPNNWWDATTKLPKYNASTTSAQLVSHSGNHAKGCSGCHLAGIGKVYTTASGETAVETYVAVLFNEDDPAYFDYDGDGHFDLANIQCESCHGPGSLHILGGGDPTKIYNGENPEDGDPLREIESCGRCHSRVTSSPTKKYNFAYNETTNQQWNPNLGVSMHDGYYIDNASYWPDQKNTKNGRQYEDFMNSGKPQFPYHQVRCSECHSFHGQSSNLHQVRSRITVDDIRVTTSPENNTFCLACHATHGPFADITTEQVAAYEENKAHIATVVSAHTFHSYKPDSEVVGMSNCIDCHMTTHTFEPIAPEKTLEYQAQGGMPNACAIACHGSWPLDWGLSTRGQCNDPATWNKPYDVKLAEHLMEYYGPEGQWWQTEERAGSPIVTNVFRPKVAAVSRPHAKTYDEYEE